MNPDLERTRIEADLKEIDLIFGQGHVRMSVIAQLTNVSVALGGGVAAGLATLVSTNTPVAIDWFLIIPLPFFVLAFLVLREDLLMAAHDRYFYELRTRLLKKVGLNETDPMLRFLPEIKRGKIGRWSTLLSGLRYAPLIFVLAPCLGWFAYNATFLFTLRGLIGAALVVLNSILLVLLVLGLLRLGREHIDNERLAPIVHSADG